MGGGISATTSSSSVDQSNCTSTNFVTQDEIYHLPQYKILGGDSQFNKLKNPENNKINLQGIRDPYLLYGGNYADDIKNTYDFKYIRFKEMPKLTTHHRSLMSKFLTLELFEKYRPNSSIDLSHTPATMSPTKDETIRTDAKISSSKDKTKTDIAYSSNVTNNTINMTQLAQYTLSNVIMTGVVNPHLKIGCTAGDEESYEVFREFFYPLIAELYRKTTCPYDPYQHTQPVSNRNYHEVQISSEQGQLFQQYIISSRVRASRNFAGYPLPGGFTDSKQRKEIFFLMKHVFGQIHTIHPSALFSQGGSSSGGGSINNCTSEHFVLDGVDSTPCPQKQQQRRQEEEGEDEVAQVLDDLLKAVDTRAAIATGNTVFRATGSYAQLPAASALTAHSSIHQSHQPGPSTAANNPTKHMSIDKAPAAATASHIFGISVHPRPSTADATERLSAPATAEAGASAVSSSSSSTVHNYSRDMNTNLSQSNLSLVINTGPNQRSNSTDSFADGNNEGKRDSRSECKTNDAKSSSSSSSSNEIRNEYHGSYYDLSGITREEQLFLMERGFLFQLPSPRSMLTGCGAMRSYPFHRGIFHNDSETVLAWVNEEDHCKLISMDVGGDLLAVFRRFCEFSGLIEHLAQSAPRQRRATYMWNSKMGFVTTCPSNLGTGLKISVILCLPAFRKLMERMQQEEGAQSGGGELDAGYGSARSTMTALSGSPDIDMMTMNPNNRFTQSTLSLATLTTVDSVDNSNNTKSRRSGDLLAAICRSLDLNVRKLSSKAAAAAAPGPSAASASKGSTAKTGGTSAAAAASAKALNSFRLTGEQETSKYEVTNRLQIGLSEIDIFQRLVDGVTRIIECERMAEDEICSVDDILAHLKKAVPQPLQTRRVDKVQH